MAKKEIPIDLITEILTRLAVKPLTRFKCVSKSWNSLISSPSFITHHSKSSPNTNIIITCDNSVFSALIPENIDSNLHFSQINHPVCNTPKNVYYTGNRPQVKYGCLISDSCNGIILIADFSKTNMFLYNPADNTHWLLPPIPTRPGFAEFFGLGYDSHTDDYKVIGVLENRCLKPEAYVYSMRDNDWKFFKNEFPSLDECFLRHGHGIGVNVKGVIYFSSVIYCNKAVLICFDVRTEAFSIVDYPELDFYGFSYLKGLRGCLCMVMNYLNHHEYGRNVLYADVWEMRENGKEFFRIQKAVLVEIGEQCLPLRVIAYSKVKSKVLIEVDSAWFGWYDLVTKMVKRVETPGLPDEYSSRVTMTYQLAMTR